MKLLIGECLSPELAKRAQSRGHGYSSHVVWLNKGGWKDWSLKRFIIDGDWTFVTKNSIDFRGPWSSRGSKGQYADAALHAGLICLNAPGGMDLDLQLELFELALDEVGEGPHQPGARNHPRGERRNSDTALCPAPGLR
jgi:hypothetical protein